MFMASRPARTLATLAGVGFFAIALGSLHGCSATPEMGDESTESTDQAATASSVESCAKSYFEGLGFRNPTLREGPAFRGVDLFLAHPPPYWFAAEKPSWRFGRNQGAMQGVLLDHPRGGHALALPL